MHIVETKIETMGVPQSISKICEKLKKEYDEVDRFSNDLLLKINDIWFDFYQAK